MKTRALTIYQDGSIQIGGKPTGVYIDGRHTTFHVRQDEDRTLVYSADTTPIPGTDGHYQEYELPFKRYALSRVETLGGIPGREQFDRDFCRALSKLSDTSGYFYGWGLQHENNNQYC